MKAFHYLAIAACALTITACENRRDNDVQNTNEPGVADTTDRVNDQTTYQQPGQIGGAKTDTGSETITTQKTETVKERVPTVEEKHVKADINRLSADEFEKLGLSKASAENITKYRKDHGDFRAVDDLKKVPGMNLAWLNQMKDKLGVAIDESRG